MALFKIEKGKSTDLFIKRPSSIEGHCYFTPDDGKFYIDVTNADQATSTTRIPLNAKYADLSYAAYRDQHGNIIDESYAKKDEGAFFIEGSGTTNSSNETSSWTGTSDRITSYYDGLTIRYKIGVAGQSTVTLNINGLGAKTVYRFNTTKLTTHFPVGSIIQLIYHEDLNGGCWVTNDYDANSDTKVTQAKAITTNGEYPILLGYSTATSAVTNTVNKTSTLKYNPNTQVLTAPTFKGNLDGNAETATALVDDRIYQTLVPTGTPIPAEADLNTPTYLSVGRYYCSQNATTKTLLNCPTETAFMMEVYSPLSTTLDNETTGTWCYRLRKLTTYTGTEYVQYCNVGATVGEWTYGNWDKTFRNIHFAKSATLTSGTEIGSITVDGHKTTFYAPSGTITGVTAGNGLTDGGTSGKVTINVGAGTGIAVAADTVSAKLRSNTALTVDSVAATTTSGRVYPVAVDKTGYLSVNVPWENTTYNAAGSDLGLVKSGEDVTISNGVITVNDNSHNHIASNITDLQELLDDKASLTGDNTFTGKNIFTASNSYNTVETQKFVVGNAGSAFVFGGDGLQCFSGINSTTGKTMYMNYYGGDIQIGGSKNADTTIMGKLTVNGSSDDSSLVINSQTASSYIQFGNSSKTTLGYLGFSATNTPVFYHTTDGAQTLYHTGNLSLVSTSTNGLMSKEDKTILNNIPQTYLPLAGGQMTGHIYLTGSQENSSTENTSQLIFGTPSNNHIAISSNKNSLIINPDLNNETSNSIVLSLNGISKFPNGLEGNLTGNVSGNATSANKVNHSLNFTVGGVYKGSFDGSEDKFIDVNAVDLNISSALSFLGIVSTAPTSATVTLTDGTTKTAVNGSVVILESTGVEYFFDGTSWTALGSGESYAIADHTHGNITNEGHISNSPNKLIRTDSEGKIISGPAISSSQTTKFLNENGTWQTVNVDNYYHTTGTWGGTDSLTYTATANGGAPALAFTLPTASTSAKGVVKIGSNISIDSGTISITKENVESALGFTPLANTTKYALSDAVGGDALAAKKLATAVTINGMSFDGSASVNNYGVCGTAAATIAKTVTVGSTFSLIPGAQVVVKFTYANSVANPTLNVNNTGAKPIYRYGTTAASTSTTVNGWTAGAVQRFTYDGTGWIMDYWYNTTYYNTTVTCNTAAATAAKVGSTSYYTLANNRQFIVMLAYDNTAASALTLNINSNGAKPIYINGTASSSSNYTLPKGLYLVYYNGTNYYFSTGANQYTGNLVALGSGLFNGTITAKSNITLTGQINKNTYSGGSWIVGRDKAALRTSISTSSSSFSPVISAKTQLGSWDLGPCHPNEDFYFSYATDTNYTAGTNTTVRAVYIKNNGVLMGAAWNDYAEYRITKEEIEPGRCVIENGDDTLSLSTARLQRGCEIVSDTFGFAIGETEESKTPIAATGRVLCYLLEGREEAKSHIGWPVCSGPNGTVSIMTEEEEEKYPSRIIGTISAVPDYEEWGSGNIKVNGRIWIRIK